MKSKKKNKKPIVKESEIPKHIGDELKRVF